MALLRVMHVANALVCFLLFYVLIGAVEHSTYGISASRRVLQDPRNASPHFWANIGANLASGVTTTVDKVVYSQQQCFAKGIELMETVAAAWIALASELPPDGKVTIRHTVYTPLDCYLKWLEYHIASAQAWHNLGTSVKTGSDTIVFGKIFTKEQCYIRSLELDASRLSTWVDLGYLLSAMPPRYFVTINGVPYGALQCYMKPLTSRNPDDEKVIAKAWYRIAGLIAADVTINGFVYDRALCLMNAIELDGTFMRAWFKLGNVLVHHKSVFIQGEEITKTVCFVKVLQLDPTIYPAWYNLALLLPKSGSESVIIAGKKYTQHDCDMMAKQLKKSDNDK